MKRSEILYLAKEIASKTSDRTSTVVFTDGSYVKTSGPWESAGKKVWCEITGKCTPREVFEALLQGREDADGVPAR